jgi:hypothetical protein
MNASLNNQEYINGFVRNNAMWTPERPGCGNERKKVCSAWNRTPVVQPVFSHTHIQMTERRLTSCRSVGHRSRLKKAAGISSATALQHCFSGQRGVFCYCQSSQFRLRESNTSRVELASVCGQQKQVPSVRRVGYQLSHVWIERVLHQRVRQPK